MSLAHGYSSNKTRRRSTIGLDRVSVLVIELPNSRILGIISKSLFLGLIVLALPSIGSFIANVSKDQSAYSNNVMPILFNDLVVEGLFTYGHKGLLLSSGIGDLFDSLWFLNDKEIDLVLDTDLDRQIAIPNEEFDFVFASSLEHVKFIDRVVKLDGIVVMPLGKYYDGSYEFLKRSNYKIVYLRQF
nr:hypothetical protein CTI12_AA039750 [Tanacetum cinerariifolium]